jgi:hypothetical protein
VQKYGRTSEKRNNKENRRRDGQETLIRPQEEDIQKEWDQVAKVMKESFQEYVEGRRSIDNKDLFTAK